MAKYSCFVSLFLLVFSTQAQYVKRSKRHKKNFINKIEIKPKDIFIVNKSLVLCDTLVMHDKATLKIRSAKPFVMYARVVKIGKKCLIDASGDHGTLNAPSGKDGTHVSLQFNVYALGSLLIKTKGGDISRKNKRFVLYKEPRSIKLPGSGGNISFYYYSPFAISLRKKGHNKPSVWFNTERGFAHYPTHPHIYQPSNTTYQLGHINGQDVIYRVNVADPNRSHDNDGRFREQKQRMMKKKKGSSIFVRLENPVKF